MPIINVNFDVHDRARVHAISSIRYERPYGRGGEAMRDKAHISAAKLLLRLVCHLDRFKAELLPQLEVPPVVGERAALAIRATEQTRLMWKGLAAVKDWAVVDLARALVFYHWTLREKARAAWPALSYAARIPMGSIDFLSFAPDRLQPWYYHENETLRALDAAGENDRAYLAELLADKGMEEEDIADVLNALNNGRPEREEYAWNADAMSPAELRQAVYRSDGGL